VLIRVKILLFILLLSPFWVRSDEQKKPTAKEAARIAVIETSFRVRFVQEITYSKDVSYWNFVRFDPTSSFQAFPFSVPVNANDESVKRALVSSMLTAQFYELMIQQMKEKPSPNPMIDF
jgi:hypothetical protein